MDGDLNADRSRRSRSSRRRARAHADAARPSRRRGNGALVRHRRRCWSRWCWAGFTGSTAIAPRRSPISSPTTSRRRRRSPRSSPRARSVPHFATGIGSLDRGASGDGHARGRRPGHRDPVSSPAPRSRPATRWSRSTTRPIAATSPTTRRRRASPRSRCSARRSLATQPIRPADRVDQTPGPARPGQGADRTRPRRSSRKS